MTAKLPLATRALACAALFAVRVLPLAWLAERRNRINIISICLVVWSGMTMVCVTHEMGFARQVADRVVFMDRGEIVESGPPNDLFENPKTDRLQLFLSQILRGH